MGKLQLQTKGRVITNMYMPVEYVYVLYPHLSSHGRVCKNNN